MDPLKDVIAKLAPDSILRALPSEELTCLLKRASQRELATGEAIINQGDDEGDFAIFLLTGGLKVTFTGANGREIILSYCSPGALVGEISLLDSGPRTATVSAVKPSTMLLLPSHVFMSAISSSPAAVASVMRELAQRVREQNLVIESDRTFSMGPRLARALVRLIDKGKPGGHLLFNPSQSDLGAFAGLARENVSRLLSEWEAQGVVKRRDKELTLLDTDYLKMLAEFGDDI